MKRFIAALLCSLCSIALMAADPLDKVDPVVIAGTENGKETSYWAIMKLQADLSPAYAMSWEDRGRFVYEELRFVAGSVQGTCVDVLTINDASKIACFWATNCMNVTSSRDALIALASLDEVKRIVADEVFAVEPPSPGIEEPQIGSVEWGIDRINAPVAWSAYGATGQGIVVALIDTGVEYFHPALIGQYRGNLGGGLFNHHRSWFDPAGICGLAPCDNNGHGTHTAGTVAGGDGLGPLANDIGVAPGCRWIACKGCESSGCSTSSLVACGQWILAPTDMSGLNPDPSKRPHICSNSWGGGRGATFYRDIVVSWKAAGILPVFAAGNAGPSCNTAISPGDYPESFAIGATDSGDLIATFSSRGPSYFGPGKPDISAPGVNVRSSRPGGLYVSLSGTSMATPHVAGAAAVLWSKIPGLIGKIDETEAVFRSSARTFTDTTCGGSNVYGAGLLNVAEAIRQALPPPPQHAFVRGRDCQNDGAFDISDAIFLLAFLFAGTTSPSCKDACDFSNDNRLDVSDSVAMLTFLFQGGVAPPPYPGCGTDSVGIGCASSICP